MAVSSLQAGADCRRGGSRRISDGAGGTLDYGSNNYCRCGIDRIEELWRRTLSGSITKIASPKLTADLRRPSSDASVIRRSRVISTGSIKKIRIPKVIAIFRSAWRAIE